jgi:predicted metalloendopeptidase
VDPCDNFYEFACGGWESVTSIPNWQSSWAKQWDGVTTDVEKKTVKALEQDDGPAGKFYKSCMDTATIQKVGTRPLKPWLAAVERVKDHASLVQALANFALADMTAFFGWFVDADSEDSSFNSFFVAQVQQRRHPHYYCCVERITSQFNCSSSYCCCCYYYHYSYYVPTTYLHTYFYDY